MGARSIRKIKRRMDGLKAVLQILQDNMEDLERELDHALLLEEHKQRHAKQKKERPNAYVVDHTAMAKEIREKRKSLKLTQAQLAERSGTKQSTISKIEKGRTVPSQKTVKAIFEALDMSYWM